MTIANGTENVIQLNAVAIRHFDPGANQYPALTVNDLQAELNNKLPYPLTQ